MTLNKQQDWKTTPVGLLDMTPDKVYSSTGVKLDPGKHGTNFEVWHPFRNIRELGKTYGDYVVTQGGLPIIASTVIGKENVSGGKLYNMKDYSTVGLQVYSLKDQIPRQVDVRKLDMMFNPAKFDFNTNAILNDKGSWVNIFTDNTPVNWIKKKLGEYTGDAYTDGYDRAHLINKSVANTWSNNLFNLVALSSKSNRVGGDKVAERIVSQHMRDPNNKNDTVIYTSIPFWTNEEKSTAKRLQTLGLKGTDTRMAAPDSVLHIIQAIKPGGQVFKPVGVMSAGKVDARILTGKELDETITRAGIKFGE